MEDYLANVREAEAEASGSWPRASGPCMQEGATLQDGFGQACMQAGGAKSAHGGAWQRCMHAAACAEMRGKGDSTIHMADGSASRGVVAC